MTVLEWAALGALGLAILLFCARIMRRGLTTLDDDRKRHEERVREETRKLSECNKKITADEQLLLARAAIADLLRLEQKECSVESSGHTIEIGLPDQTVRVRLKMREINLRSTHRALHGQSRWLLEASGLAEEYRDIAGLMARLNDLLHGAKVEGVPEHIARRLAAAKSSRKWSGAPRV
ncbi:MAG: translation initiation factor IF-2 [Desulfovibrio sp.]|nr:translation initiation factor IF-2 [Desulfovibrio sp.]